MGKLGDTLRERRMALGISLVQVENATRIRARMIEALEDGDYAALPDPGYVRGYISSYARFLELEPAPLLSLYKAETGAVRFHKIDLPQIEEAVVPTGEQHAVPWRIALTTVAVVAVLAAVVWGVMRFARPTEETPPVPVVPSETSSTPTETAVPVQQQEEPTSTSVALVPFTTVIKISDEGASWLTIAVDGKPAYNGKLAAGQSKSFEVAKSIKIEMGKPEYVTITRDGQPVTVKGTSVTLKAEPTR